MNYRDMLLESYLNDDYDAYYEDYEDYEDEDDYENAYMEGYMTALAEQQAAMKNGFMTGEKLANLQKSFAKHTSILNNPNSTPEQKRKAKMAIDNMTKTASEYGVDLTKKSKRTKDDYRKVVARSNDPNKRPPVAAPGAAPGSPAAKKGMSRGKKVAIGAGAAGAAALVAGGGAAIALRSKYKKWKAAKKSRADVSFSEWMKMGRPVNESFYDYDYDYDDDYYNEDYDYYNEDYDYDDYYDEDDAYLEGYYYALEEMGLLEDDYDYDDEIEDAYLEGYACALIEEEKTKIMKNIHNLKSDIAADKAAKKAAKDAYETYKLETGIKLSRDEYEDKKKRAWKEAQKKNPERYRTYDMYLAAMAERKDAGRGSEGVLSRNSRRQQELRAKTGTVNAKADLKRAKNDLRAARQGC